MDSGHSDGEGPQATEDLSQRHGTNRLACDICRSRKVGCDRKNPCSNCTRAGVECTTTLKPRTAVARQRVRVSAGYDQKISNIEERLEEAVCLLRQLAVESSRNHDSHSQQLSPGLCQESGISTMPDSSKTTPISTEGCKNSTEHSSLPLRPSQPTVEGDSSLAAQTALASDILDTTIGKSPHLEAWPGTDLSGAVEALRAIMKAQKEYSQVHDFSWPSTMSTDNSAGPPLRGCNLADLPPVESAMSSIRWAREDPRMQQVIFIGFHLLTFDQLMEHAVRLYFPGPYAESDYIIVNGALGSLYNERLIFEQDPELRKELKRYKELCNNNMETALNHLPMQMPVTFENVKALGFGATHALFTARPAVLWTLTSMALNMCQTMGYHKMQSLKNDPPDLREQKIWMFWTTYTTSKALSLRLGRSSVMPDYDISVPMPKPDEDKFNRFSNAMVRCMRFSRIQGKVYEVLYSYSALSQPATIRAHRARVLAEELKVVYYRQIKQVEARIAKRWAHAHSFQVKIGQLSSELQYHILNTLILRAIPVAPGSPSSISAECIEAARTTIAKHLEYMPIMTEALPAHIYFKAILLYMPFTPFIVLFCHVIETSNASDLERLRAFVASLESCTINIESCKNLRQLFQSLFHVARVYIDSKTPRTATSASTTTSASGVRKSKKEVATADFGVTSSETWDGGHQGVRSTGLSLDSSADGLGTLMSYDDQGVLYNNFDRNDNMGNSDFSTNNDDNDHNMQLDAYLREMGMLPPQDWYDQQQQAQAGDAQRYAGNMTNASEPGHFGYANSNRTTNDNNMMAMNMIPDPVFHMGLDVDADYDMDSGNNGNMQQPAAYYLADWFSSNQQIMAMLDDSVF